MRLKFSEGWLDYDLNLYRDIARPIDLKIDELFDVIETDFSTADILDYPLTVEHLLGVGLAAAQVYLVAAIGERGAPRQTALSIGPRHPSGAAVVQLINHGANFWKHADEWDYEVPDGRRDVILRAFSDLGITEDHYTLIELVKRITGATQPRLTELSPFLEEWRNALDEAFPETAGTYDRDSE